MELTFKKRYHGGWIFQVSAYTSSNPAYAAHVAFGTPMEHDNQLRSLSAGAENTIVAFLKDEIVKHRETGEPIMLVMDISEFPFIAVYIDARDQNEVMASQDDEPQDQFAKDVIATWTELNAVKGDEIPVIIVNTYNSATSLKKMNIRM